MVAVKNRQREKNLIIKENKYNTQPVSSVNFLGFSVPKEGTVPNNTQINKLRNAKQPSNIKQLESFFGLPNFFGQMIPDFATLLQKSDLKTKFEKTTSDGKSKNRTLSKT